jgi:hypothetical protein
MVGLFQAGLFNFQSLACPSRSTAFATKTSSPGSQLFKEWVFCQQKMNSVFVIRDQNTACQALCRPVNRERRGGSLVEIGRLPNRPRRLGGCSSSRPPTSVKNGRASKTGEVAGQNRPVSAGAADSTLCISIPIKRPCRCCVSVPAQGWALSSRVCHHLRRPRLPLRDGCTKSNMTASVSSLAGMVPACG